MRFGDRLLFLSRVPGALGMQQLPEQRRAFLESFLADFEGSRRRAVRDTVALCMRRQGVPWGLRRRIVEAVDPGGPALVTSFARRMRALWNRWPPLCDWRDDARSEMRLLLEAVYQLREPGIALTPVLRRVRQMVLPDGHPELASAQAAAWKDMLRVRSTQLDRSYWFIKPILAAEYVWKRENFGKAKKLGKQLEKLSKQLFVYDRPNARLFFPCICGMGGFAMECMDMWIPLKDIRPLIDWLDDGQDSEPLLQIASKEIQKACSPKNGVFHLASNATNMGQKAAVELMISNNYVQGADRLLLLKAAVHGHIDLVDYFLFHQKLPIIYPCHAFFVAAYSDSLIDVMDTLVRAGVDVNSVDDTGKTALVIAAQKSQNRIITYLTRLPELRVDEPAVLDESVNSSEVDIYGETSTALRWAVEAKNVRGVKLLLARGANPATKCDNGRRSMMDAATPEIRTLLEEARKKKEKS